MSQVATRVRDVKCIMVALWALVLLSSSTFPSLAQNSCPTIAPLQSVGGVQWYADKSSSVVDPEKRRQHEEALKPLYDLMRLISNAADHELDNAVRGDPMCARENLRIWASAGALLTRPAWGFSLAEQTIAVVGLNVVALKFKSANEPLSPTVLDWIHRTTDTIVKTYEGNTQRGNLYAWSGVAAASNDLLTGRKTYASYHARVWQESTNQIRPDGYVDTELSRKARALIYHNYLRGALTLLKRLRLRLGDSEKPGELHNLSRLDAVVNANACDASAISKLADAPQQSLTDWDTSISTYFAEASKDPTWRQCTQTRLGFSGPTYGGRFDLTSRVLDQLQPR